MSCFVCESFAGECAAYPRVVGRVMMRLAHLAYNGRPWRHLSRAETGRLFGDNEDMMFATTAEHHAVVRTDAGATLPVPELTRGQR